MNSETIQKFLGEVKDAFEKAIISSSASLGKPADEKTVENYVRNGGNTMENTTEPDPQGDIAVTKAYPDAISDAKNVIGSATNPNGDIAVTDAPEGPVPTNETSPSDATSAIAPTSEEMAEPIEKAASCKECGQALPMEKAEEITKAEESAETAEEEAKEKPEHDVAEHSKEEMKKSVWGGAFAPFRK